ncbi:unnamed protein product, partial [Darwinula stevensoni]
MAGLSVKQEPMDIDRPGPSNNSEVIETRILELCTEFPKGVPDKVLQNDMPLLDAKERVNAINRLLAKGKIDLFKQGTELVYRQKAATVLKGGENEEKIVYQLISEAGNKGIWIRDIRLKSNLALTHVNKVLKALEGRKLIKAVKSVSASKKKVYMLQDTVPDRSLTGGAWYSEQDFEAEFVAVLMQQCYRYLQEKAVAAKKVQGGPLAIRNASFVSSAAVCTFISELGISKVALSLDDIETILNTLIFDGKVEKSIAVSGESGAGTDTKLFRAVESPLTAPGLVRMPCGICPISKNCSDIGAVTPKKCQYLKDWLNP